MREPTFLILAALADQPRHGYGIIQEVAALSAGRVTLLPGTLYTALDRLAAQGLVARDREEVVDGRLRRYYRLTSDGLAALDAETARLRALATVAERKLRRHVRDQPAVAVRPRPA
ncbi:PadR family transcriptional regulator [Micromonospora sp. HM5-17]|jgi:DNA-binding PadR family transcriptional regulator|uniref:PadR family transcriptional regulator n=1 Tax=Micromonospora sp. HM5-17 TaxID=2487710 RepID=UPI000F4A3B1E|nr:PadR family transcriptional regulator [Micromonospora sp. HM5-17]ROT32156.1 PadR family transcriptional regulator [Micromonospora sp. HM5-17]